MNDLLNIYKPLTLTPKQLIDKLKAKYPIYNKVKIGYAGRLDPMAHGVLLLTIAEGNKIREKFLSLNKSYLFTILLGIETDSYDLLGKVTSKKINTNIPQNLEIMINHFVKNYQGKIIQTYPPYSSKTVQGIPLYKWSKDNKLDQILLPTKEITIYQFNFLSKEIFTKKELLKSIKKIKQVKGEFRQNEILESWNALLKFNDLNQFIALNFEISCSSGTYIRTIAHLIGQHLKTGAIVIKLLRTRVGNYTLQNSLIID